MKKLVFLFIITFAGCSWIGSANVRAPNKNCSAITKWDDCARATNCIHARAWHTDGGEFSETWVCIEKNKREALR